MAQTMITPGEIEQAKAALDRALDFFKADTFGIMRTHVSGFPGGRSLIGVEARRFNRGTPHLYIWGQAGPLIIEYMQQCLVTWDKENL